ncbi:hypothetical protein M9434_006268 [Picochlorum sp. BPE23]|nr:hypothetical protein M9434_006268 [Picochlorum sp. BPE23]
MGEGWRFVDQNAAIRQLKKYEAVSAVPSIYVTGIPLSGHPMSDEEGLRNEFEGFGTISDIYFVSPQSRDGTTPKSSRGASPSWSNRDDDDDGDDDDGDSNTSFRTAIVKYENWTAAEKAYLKYNNTTNNASSGGEGEEDASICVRYARPRSSGDEAISPRRLFIGQIPRDCTETDLQNQFLRFGNIIELSMFDKNSKGMPLCAFIEYDSWAASDKAIAECHGKVVFSSSSADKHQHKAIVVKYAKAKMSPSSSQMQMQTQGEMHASPGGVYWPIPLYPAYFGPYEQPMYPVFYQPLPEATRYQEHVDRRKLFVGQLPLYATEDALMSIFSSFGVVERVSILPQRGCGFVTFQYRDQATIAAQNMNGRPYREGSRPMVVKFASRRTRATSPSGSADS